MLVRSGSGYLSACLLRRLASRFLASLACLVSTCSAARCWWLRSHILSSLDWSSLQPFCCSVFIVTLGLSSQSALPSLGLLRCSMLMVALTLPIKPGPFSFRLLRCSALMVALTLSIKSGPFSFRLLHCLGLWSCSHCLSNLACLTSGCSDHLCL